MSTISVSICTSITSWAPCPLPPPPFPPAPCPLPLVPPSSLPLARRIEAIWPTTLKLPQPWGDKDIVVAKYKPCGRGHVSNYLVVNQVYKLLVVEGGFNISETTFRNSLIESSTSPPLVKESNKVIMGKLKSFKVIGPQAPVTTLVKAKVAIKALGTSLSMSPDVLELLQPLTTMEPQATTTPSTSTFFVSTRQQGQTLPPLNTPSQNNQPTQAPPPNTPPTITFPSTIQVPTLTQTQQSECYGLDFLTQGRPWPSTLSKEVKGLRDWSKDLIRLDRDERYSPNQESTWETYMSTINCFMGYMVKFSKVPLQSLSIHLYREPDKVAQFLGYIVARGVGRSWVGKHVSLAKKVCSYLQSTSPWHAQASMEVWLTRLERQLPNIIPMPKPRELPPPLEVFQWVDDMVELSKDLVVEAYLSYGKLDVRSAWQVHNTCIAMMVTGKHILN